MTPLISSVESKLAESEIEKKIDDIFTINESLINILENNKNDLTIIEIIKCLIFLFLMFPVFFLIYALTFYQQWRNFTLLEIISLYFIVLFDLIDFIIP
jgi:hypothetical protein